MEDGKITGLTPGHAIVTATATDALGNRVEASCDVTVAEEPYNVEVYVPKGILASKRTEICSIRQAWMQQDMTSLIRNR